MIWGQTNAGVIGRAGEMPWHLPEDLAHFKETTLNTAVIMGRKTWDSLPEKFRPLPGRINIVITRQIGLLLEGAETVASLEEALASVKARSVPNEPDVNEREVAAWVMGGGEIYRQAMPLASELSVTQIDLEVTDADTFAPGIPESFKLVSESETLISSTGLNYRFQKYIKS